MSERTPSCATGATSAHPPKVRLGEVCKQIRGVSYKPADASTMRKNDYVPLLRANNISEGLINHEDLVFVKRERVLDSQYLQQGDVLVCTSSGSLKLVGKAALILSTAEESFGAFCRVLRPDSALSASYFSHYFQSETYRRTISGKAAGANINNIRNEDLDDLQIPLPPLVAQRQIATRLDRICEIVEKRKAQLAQLQQLVKSRFVEMFGEGKNPESELITVTTFIDYRGKTPTKSDDGIPLITAKNVRANGFSIEPREYMPEALFAEWMTRGYPRVGDVLFTTEAPLGNVCRIPNLYDRFAVGQRIVTMQVNEAVLDSAYLEHALKSETFQRKIKQKSSGSTVTGIRCKLLERLSIPIPPLALQREFAAFVAKVDRLEAAVKKGLEAAERLYRQQLQEVFDIADNIADNIGDHRTRDHRTRDHRTRDHRTRDNMPQPQLLKEGL